MLIACKGSNNMHVVECMHAIQPIQHTHQGEDKKQVQLGLNVHFGKLMHMTTRAHLKINTDTMHQCVTSSTTPKKSMCMPADELDGGATQCTRMQWRQEFALARCHHGARAHHHGQPSLASAHHLHNHKHVKELVSSQ